MKINEIFDKKPDPPPISPNLAAPIDAAVAFNVTSDDSTTDASAEQDVNIDENAEAQT